ncbi:hypothetical protein [Methylacidimicrobium tartarophylax]|uniref:Uncharacterized protein n=1 Tax=Methylacidimicrobium tartarophylax TaxID=1041768 RepID=A0A5E6M4G7_9BACT|nr:hypothetical protein [Methylacidimicrobium tartarophylax]VVM04461.1 hypothetical protein MAMT_00093 [Methylacidimicrobium tartarophylax]
MPTDTIETRMAHLEGAYEQIDKRLGTVEQRLTLVETKLDGLRRDIDQRFERVDQRFERVEARFERLEHSLRTQFSWVMGLMLSLLALGLFRH